MFVCNACNDKKFDNENSYSNHLISEEHMLQAESVSTEELDLACDICTIKVCGIVPYKQHLQGKKHKKKAEQLKISQQLKRSSLKTRGINSEKYDADLDGNLSVNVGNNSSEETEVNKESSTVHKQMWSCNVCNKFFPNYMIFDQHFHTDCHINNQKKCQILKAELQTSSNTNISMNFSNTQASDSEGKRENLLQDINAESSHSLNTISDNLSGLLLASGEGDNLPENLESTSDNQAADFFCEVCKVVCTGIIPYSEHIQSRKHIKEQEKQKMLCEIANQRTAGRLKTSPTLLGKQGETSHSSKDKTMPGNHFIEENGDSLMSVNESLLSENSDCSINNLPAFANIMTCSICNVPCSGVIPFQQHMSSQKHAKEVEKKKMFEKMKSTNYYSEIEHYGNTKAQDEPEICKLNSLMNSASLEEFQASDLNSSLSFEESCSSSSDSFANLSADEAKAAFVNIITCDVCKINCSGIIPFKQHISSIKHMKVLETKKFLKQNNQNKSRFCQIVAEHDMDITKTTQLADHQNLLNTSQIQNDHAQDKPKSQLYVCTERLNVSDSNIYSSEDVYKCQLCNESFSGKAPYEQHLYSLKHAKQFERKKALLKLSSTYSETQQVDENKSPKYFPENKSFLDDSDEKLNSSLNNSDESYVAGSDDNEVESSYVFKCAVCKTSFSGIIPYTQHMRSNKHKRQLEKHEMLKRLKETQNPHLLLPKSNNVNHESAIVISRDMETFSNPEMVLANNKMKGDSDKEHDIPILASSYSDTEASVVIINEEDFELGCEACGIGGFVNRRARDEHFQTEDHLQAKNYKVPVALG